MNPKKFHIILLLISFISIATGLPSRRFREVDESSVTTRIIDLNNPEDKGLLQKFNISAEQLRQIQSARQSSSGVPSTDENDRLSDIKEMRFQDIKIKIENAISPNVMNNENIIHEMAAYPSCGQLNESSWQEENNITIRFAASLFENPHPDMYLDTAVLRLFKLDPQAPIRTTPRSANCEDIPIESQIRVTVSTIQQLRRNRRVNNPFDHFSAERKKRICNTIMLNVSQTGWVEIDVKKAINLWEKAERPSRNANYNNNNNRPVMVGWLTIEVHDEEERPLKTGLYFEPPKCSEADAAIPWNFYRIYASSPSTDMEKVPRSPRLDIKLITKNVSTTHRHTHHRNVYRHSSNPLCTDQLPITDSLEFPEVRNHKKRHEQSHHARHHHHHHSERRQDTTDDNPHQQN